MSKQMKIILALSVIVGTVLIIAMVYVSAKRIAGTEATQQHNDSAESPTAQP